MGAAGCINWGFVTFQNQCVADMMGKVITPIWGINFLLYLFHSTVVPEPTLETVHLTRLCTMCSLFLSFFGSVGIKLSKWNSFEARKQDNFFKCEGHETLTVSFFLMSLLLGFNFLGSNHTLKRLACVCTTIGCTATMFIMKPSSLEFGGLSIQKSHFFCLLELLAGTIGWNASAAVVTRFEANFKATQNRGQDQDPNSRYHFGISVEELELLDKWEWPQCHDHKAGWGATSKLTDLFYDG